MVSISSWWPGWKTSKGVNRWLSALSKTGSKSSATASRTEPREAVHAPSSADSCRYIAFEKPCLPGASDTTLCIPTNNVPSSVLNLLQQRHLGRSQHHLAVRSATRTRAPPLRPPPHKLRRAARSAVSGGEKIGHKSADGRALAPTAGGDRQGSARKDVVFGAARAYTVTAPGPKWKSWFNGAAVFRARKLVVPDPTGNGPQNLAIKPHARCEETNGNLGTPSPTHWRQSELNWPWFSSCCLATTGFADATCWSLPLACVGVVQNLNEIPRTEGWSRARRMSILGGLLQTEALRFPPLFVSESPLSFVVVISLILSNDNSVQNCTAGPARGSLHAPRADVPPADVSVSISAVFLGPRCSVRVDLSALCTNACCTSRWEPLLRPARA